MHEFAPAGTWKAPDELPNGLDYEQDGPVATLTLDRPERLNALTFETYEALRDVFAQFDEDESVRSVVLTGSGAGFCSGGDVEAIIGELVEMSAKRQERFTRLTCDVVESMRTCPQPIVAKLNGTVAGAGAALAIASDLRVAVPDATISFLFTQAGLSAADMGASHLLPRLVGLGPASELLMLGRPVDAEEALDLGLYNRVVDPENLDTTATKMAETLAEGPRMGLSVTKQALDEQAGLSLAESLNWDATRQAECMQHPDFEEAYRAFVEDREANFE
jgi:enoyl-CoA hydratase/carnithine racemase